MIRRYIICRNNHAYDERLRQIVNRANVAATALAAPAGLGNRAGTMGAPGEMLRAVMQGGQDDSN
jgi:hypothetical protein